MSLLAVILAALAFWGYGGVQVHSSFGIPQHFPPWVIAGGAPDDINGGCVLWLREEMWVNWSDDTRVRVVAHELFHCLARSGEHDDDPTSIMTGGIGTEAKPHHWLALIEARPPLPHKSVAPFISR